MDAVLHGSLHQRTVRDRLGAHLRLLLRVSRVANFRFFLTLDLALKFRKVIQAITPNEPEEVIHGAQYPKADVVALAVLTAKFVEMIFV